MFIFEVSTVLCKFPCPLIKYYFYGHMFPSQISTWFLKLPNIPIFPPYIYCQSFHILSRLQSLRNIYVWYTKVSKTNLWKWWPFYFVSMNNKMILEYVKSGIWLKNVMPTCLAREAIPHWTWPCLPFVWFKSKSR